MKSHNEIPLIQVMWWARDARCVKGSDWEVLMALIMRANVKNGFTCWPEYKSIARDTGLYWETVRDAVNRLTKKELVQKVVRSNNSNFYTVNVELLKQKAAAVKAAEQAEKESGPIEIRIAYDAFREARTVDDLPLTQQEKEVFGEIHHQEDGPNVDEKWDHIKKPGEYTRADCADTGKGYHLMRDQNGNTLRLEGDDCHCRRSLDDFNPIEIRITGEMLRGCKTLDELPLTEFQKRVVERFTGQLDRKQFQLAEKWKRQPVGSGDQCAECADSGQQLLSLVDDHGNKLTIEAGKCSCQLAKAA